MSRQGYFFGGGRSKGRDPVWQKIIEIFDLQSDTRQERNRLGRFRREFAAKLGARPAEYLDQMVTAYGDYFRDHKMPDVLCTPDALLKWWGQVEGWLARRQQQIEAREDQADVECRRRRSEKAAEQVRLAIEARQQLAKLTKATDRQVEAALAAACRRFGRDAAPMGWRGSALWRTAVLMELK